MAFLDELEYGANLLLELLLHKNHRIDILP
jgi:hypothetical protein